MAGGVLQAGILDAEVSTASGLGGPTLEALDAQRERLRAMLAEIRAGVPKGWRIASVRRAELDRFLFGPEDIVVAVGQDGLVANLAKYLDGQPVIGVNGDPDRNAGVLVVHAPGAVAGLLARFAAGTLATEGRTMIRAELDDGQTLLALNEVFVGHASHQSARYTLAHGGNQEVQSSSGVIVASGTGATGWALSIGRATGIAVDLDPCEAAAMFLVREPWPSRATGASLTAGRLAAGDVLLLASRMNEGGVVFADGIEADRLEFGWGRILRVALAERRLRFVANPAVHAPRRQAAQAPRERPPATSPRATRPPATSPARAPTVPVTAKSSPWGPGIRPAVGPGTKRRRRLRPLLLGALLALVLVRACGWPGDDDASDQPTSGVPARDMPAR